MKTLLTYLFSMGLICILGSCDTEFLEAKPQKSLLVPSTLTDMEALLNNSRDVMNRAGYLSLAADGDFRISESYLQSVIEPIRFNYSWSDQTTSWIADWDYAYQQIFYANVVLQGVHRLKKDNNEALADELKGRALFYRAWALHLLSQQFAGVYIKETAASTPGIPCPLSPDVNQKIKRASIKETYDRIFTDLLEALELLPNTATYNTQPSKGSAYALLARMYLITEEYDKALDVADSTLIINDFLSDYNTINADLARPFPAPGASPNPEILYYSLGNTAFTSSVGTFVDSSLYRHYSDSDLRKKIYFNSSLNYKGSYTGGTTPFVGLATDEVYLIKAECQARLGMLDEALEVLNYFLSKRYVSQSFTFKSETNPPELLKLILLERRKELIGRGITWIDLRRLNKQPPYQRTLTRTIAGTNHTLTPGDKRYIMKIPMDEIASSGIEQNP
jgi:tetratricopeptide (TPR) repeat protein